MRRAAAVLIGGPPATGKSTLAAALAPEMGAALLDLDVVTGPLTRVVSGLVGVRDLEDPVLAGLTRAARYDTLIARLTRRALSRDEDKLRDPAAFLAGLDLEPPVVPHLALDAAQPTCTLVRY